MEVESRQGYLDIKNSLIKSSRRAFWKMSLWNKMESRINCRMGSSSSNFLIHIDFDIINVFRWIYLHSN